MKEIIIATYKTLKEAYEGQNYPTVGMFRPNKEGHYEYVITVKEPDDPKTCNCSSPDCEYKVMPEWCETHEQVMWKDGLKCSGCLMALAEDANMFKTTQ